ILDKSPDAKTIWLFKETLRKHQLEQVLFEEFHQFLRENNIKLSKGSATPLAGDAPQPCPFSQGSFPRLESGPRLIQATLRVSRCLQARSNSIIVRHLL
ncbi:MAG: hypothetical protein AAF975_04675, partial [Spirochaetota bacterium]